MHAKESGAVSSYRRLRAQAIAACAVLVALSGCGTKATPATVVVLFDQSRSTDSYEIRSLYKRDFSKVTRHFEDGGGGMLVGDVINENSLLSSDPFVQTFEQKDEDTSANVFETEIRTAIAAAKRKADAMIDGKRETGGTSILAALQNADDFFDRQPRSDRFLVLLSDMVEVSPEFTMTWKNLKPERVRAFIDSQRSRDLLPDLSGVRVYAVGAGTTSRKLLPASKVEAIRYFWDQYFAATGAELVQFRTTLLEFPARA